MVTTRLYRNGVLTEHDFPVARISDCIELGGSTVWADFVSPTADDLAAIEEELGLHPLAVEDAVHEHQRAKLDRYDTHLFLATYDVDVDDEGRLERVEVKAFITRKALITVHGPEFDISRVVARWDASADLAKNGVPFLLWGLLDEVIDGHFETVQKLDAVIEDLEEALFDDKPRDHEVQRRAFELRRSLVTLRRVVLPMREVVNTLMRRDEVDVRSHEMMPYFQDVYDHVLRVTEWTESLRDLVTTVLETNVGIQGNRMNNIMKKVTSWAAIIAVPTAITGFYGQNVPYPGFSSEVGFWVSSALIVVVSGGLYAAFRRNGWL